MIANVRIHAQGERDRVRDRDRERERERPISNLFHLKRSHPENQQNTC